MSSNMSSLGVNYGEILPIYGGIVIDVATLPDDVYFFVTNGNWNGYITTDNEGKRVMYTGVNVSLSNPIKDGEYAAKRTINIGRHYDAAIGTIFRKDEKGNRHEMNEYLV